MPIDFNKITTASSSYFGGVKSSPAAAITTARDKKYGIDFSKITTSKKPLLTYEPPKPVDIPKYALQGAMAASQSLQTKAVKDYYTPSLFRASQAESDEVQKMSDYYKTQPKYAPAIDMMAQINGRFGGDYSTNNPGQTALNFVGTLAKVGIGAWLLTTQVAGFVTAAIGTVKAVKLNNMIISSLQNVAELEKTDQNLASTGSEDGAERIGFDSAAIARANDATTQWSHLSSAVNVTNEEKFNAYYDAVKACSDAIRTAHVVNLSQEPSDSVIVPYGAFTSSFGAEASIQPFIPSGIPETSAAQLQKAISVPQLMGQIASPPQTSSIGQPTVSTPVSITTKQPWQMTREEFMSPPPLPVAHKGNVIVYHALAKDSDLQSVQQNGLLISKKQVGGEGPAVLWGTDTPTGYSKDKTIIGIELPSNAVVPVAGNQYQIIRDVSPNEIVYVDKHGTSPISSGLRINEERASKYASKYYDAYIAMEHPTQSPSTGTTKIVSGVSVVPNSFINIPSSQAKEIIGNGRYGIFSTYTGDTTEEANKAKAVAYSKETGRDILESQYGGREKAHIVSADEVKALAEKYHQQSYLVANNHHYEMFDTETGKKIMEGDAIAFDNSLPDFYTEVQTADGPMRFSMDLHDVDGNQTEADIAAHQTEANVLLAAAENQGISIPSISAGATSSQGAKDVAIGNFAKAVNRNINIAGTHRDIDFSGFHWGARTFKVSDSANIIAPDGIDSIGAATALVNAYQNEPEKIKIRTIRYDLESGSGSQWNHEHAGFSATGKSITSIQNELDKGFVVVRLIANSTGSAPTIKSLKEANITELWTAFKSNQTFIDAVNDRMPGFLENHPDFQPTGLNKKSINVDERLTLTQIANDISSDYNKVRSGRVSGVAIIAKNGIIDIQRTSWNKFDQHVLGHFPSIISGAYFEYEDPAQMPLYDDIIAAETPISGFKPNTYKAPFLESILFNTSNPEIRKLMDTVVGGIEDFRRQTGLSGNVPTSGTQTNATNPPQPQYGEQQYNGTGIDLSKYDLEPPTEQVVSSINGALRPGYLNITSVAHMINTPARVFSQLLNNDPLKIGLDKLGAYDLLYGKETNAELRLGQGNPSLWNLGFVPATAKSIMLWGELFSAQTRMTFKDISVEADLERDNLIKYDRKVAGLSKDEFVQLLWDIKRGGTGRLPTQQQVVPTKTQELANEYIAISQRAVQNLTAAGLDPQIFARLQGHYLPAPSDELGQDILPTIDEKMTVKPSLGFIEKQVLPQEVIIGMASQDDTWQDYRDYMVARMAAEIRAGEKGRFFGAIAADPHTQAISPNAIDFNTGKRVVIPNGYVTFSLGGEKKSFALDGYAIPKWVALFINNEFTSKQAMEQMKGIQEILGQWKWNKAIANVPTLIRNLISQLTFQSLESGLSVMNLDDYLIRPLGALLGLNKADQNELINLGLVDSGMIRELEGLGFSPQERALWQSGQDRGLKLGMIYDKFKTARNVVSSVYAFSDNLTKAGAYYAARRNFDQRTARVLASLTTGDYSQRPPVVNYLTRGIYNGHVNPFAMAFSSPFAFFKLIVEPQRVGNLLRFHPTLLVAGLLAASLGIKALVKKLQKDYMMSEQQATALVNQFENYYWLNGKYVIPTGKNEGIDVTSMIPMLNFIVEAKKALIEEKSLSQILSTANHLITGVDSANFILETLVSFSTGYDLNYFLQYSSLKSIGKTNAEQMLWLAEQFSPTWLNKLLIKKPNGNDFSLADLTGQYKLTLSEAEKNKAWYYIKTDPNIPIADKKRYAAAYFGPNSLEQIGWNRIMNGGK
jgi:hypothetical protein